MFLLRHKRNENNKSNIAAPGDVVVNGDKRASYLVHTDGSYRRNKPEDHQMIIKKLDSQQRERAKALAPVLAESTDGPIEVQPVHPIQQAIIDGFEQEREATRMRIANNQLALDSVRRLEAAREAESKRLNKLRNKLGRYLLSWVPERRHKSWPFRLLSSCKVVQLTVK